MANDILKCYLVIKDENNKLQLLRNDDPFFTWASFTAAERCEKQGQRFKVFVSEGSTTPYYCEVMFKSQTEMECINFLKLLIEKVERRGGQVPLLRSPMMTAEERDASLAQPDGFVKSLTAAIFRRTVVALFVHPDGSFTFNPFTVAEGSTSTFNDVARGSFEFPGFHNFSLVENRVVIVSENFDCHKISKNCKPRLGQHYFGIYGPTGKVVRKGKQFFLNIDGPLFKLLDFLQGTQTGLNRVFDYDSHI